MELCKQLSCKYKIYAACRSASSELSELISTIANGSKIIEDVDVTTPAGIESLVTGVGSAEIDLLVNNAGILTRETLGTVLLPEAQENIKAQFAANAMGPLLVTTALLGNVKDNSKIAIISSRMGSIADNCSGGRYGYRMSKAAANAAGVSLSWDLAPRGISVQLLHPGLVATDMTAMPGGGHPCDAISVTDSARGIVMRIEEMNMENTGKFFHSNGEELPW